MTFFWRQLGFHYFPLCTLKGHPCGQHPLDFPYPVAAPDFFLFCWRLQFIFILPYMIIVSIKNRPALSGRLAVACLCQNVLVCIYLLFKVLSLTEQWWRWGRIRVRIRRHGSRKPKGLVMINVFYKRGTHTDTHTVEWVNWNGKHNTTKAGRVPF